MSDPVIVEVTIAAPIDAVWRALRDPAEIRRWFGWEYDGLDDEIQFIFFQESKADDDAHVLDGGEGGALALEARGDGTLVRVTRAAPADGYDEVNEGWLTLHPAAALLPRTPSRAGACDGPRRDLGRRVVPVREPDRLRARRRRARDPHADARDRQRVPLNARSNSRIACRPGSGESSSTTPSRRSPRRTLATRQRPAASV